MRLPALVVGGGLTGIDTTTELAAYYPLQVEKFLARWEALAAEAFVLRLGVKTQPMQQVPVGRERRRGGDPRHERARRGGAVRARAGIEVVERDPWDDDAADPLGTTTLMSIALLSVRQARSTDAAIARQPTEQPPKLSPPHEPSSARPPRAPARPQSTVPSAQTPAMAMFGGQRVGAEQQPTTQFARPVRGRDFDRRDVDHQDHRTDPYAELRDLLPAGAWAYDDHPSDSRS